MKFMKAFKIISAFLCVLCASAFICPAQDGYTVECDTNGVSLPGFYFPGTNVLGTVPIANLPTNLVTTAQFSSGTNSIITNTAAQFVIASNAVNMASNVFAAFDATLAGISNFMNNADNSAIIGGLKNIINSGTPHTYDCMMQGGQYNLLAGQSLDSFFVGGVSNRMDGDSQSTILGGEFNWLNGASQSSIIGGTHNLLSGSRNVTLGGINNLIQYTYDTDDVMLGGSNVVTWGAFNVLAGRDITCGYSDCFIFADYFGTTNFVATGNNQFLIRAYGGVGIGTNNPGTNQLAVTGNSDFQSLSCQGTNILGLLNTLSVAFNYNLTIVSNASAGTNANTIASLNIVSNFVVAVSNQVSTATKNLTNALSSITQSKAFYAALPATYGSIGIGFSTPLMPDANYSVELTPTDQNTANAAMNGMSWWVDTFNASGFTLHANYATNAYNLNFACIIKENTQ